MEKPQSKYITWREILDSFNNVGESRLSDRAVLYQNGEFIPIDLIEIELPEIDDCRIVAITLEELDG
jgi:hypothetical protein